MNTSAFWIIILGFWVFVLQRKVAHVEEMLANIKNKLDTSSEVKSTETLKKPVVKESVKETDIDDIVAMHDVENYVYDKPIKLAIEEPISSVKAFKEATEEVSPPQAVEKVDPKVHEPKNIEPQEPSKIVTFITNYFTGGNLLVRIGSVILFFGLAFLVKYAAEHTVISIEMRLWFIAFVSLVLIVLGWKLRNKEGAYGQVLQGLGIAILYLLIYAASKFYTLLSSDMAFILMLAVVIVGSVLAVIEDALPLALFATAGGFLVPILTSTGEGSHITLFTYYALLNIGIFTVAWYRSWRVLNIVGFVFTFIISATWGVSRYVPELFSRTEPFLILYFLMYLSISILFTIKHPYEPKNLVDGTLVFGLPVVAFPLQLKMVALFEYGEAYSAVALGLLYVGLFYLLKNKERTTLLAQSFLALGVVFLTISIPYIFDADVSAALWSLESAGIVWIALKQNKVLTRYFGQALLFLSLFVYPSSVASLGVTVAEYLGYIILITAVVITSYLLDTHRPKLFSFDRMYVKVLLGISVVLWFMSTPTQMMRFSFTHAETMLFSLVVLVGLLSVVIHFSKWKMLITALQGYFPLGVAFCAYSMIDASHPFDGLGALLVGMFVSLGYGLLYIHHKVWHYAKQMHSLLLWFMVVVLALELRYHVYLLMYAEIIEALLYVGYLFVIVGAGVGAYFLDKYAHLLTTLDKHIAKIFLALSLLLWISCTSTQLMSFEMFNHYEVLSSFIVGALLLFLVSKKVQWALLHQTLQGYFPLGMVLIVLGFTQVTHPFYGVGTVVLGVFIVFNYALLYKHEKTWTRSKQWHILTLWFMVFIGILELRYHVGVLHTHTSFMALATVLSPVFFSLLFLVPKQYWGRLENHRANYQFIGVGGLVLLMSLWTLKTFGIDAPSSTAYMPLFNPLDLTQALVLGVIAYWVVKNKKTFAKGNTIQLYGTLAFLVSIFVTVVFARAVHVMRGVDYTMASLWQDDYFQTGLSILWSMIAIVLMLLSKRYSNRLFWLAGFGLLILVVLKLFFVELANSGTIERIISFMVVGTLLLIIGYFVPLPPSKDVKQ